MIGAYATFEVQRLFGHTPDNPSDWYYIAALPVAFLAAAFVGYLIELPRSSATCIDAHWSHCWRRGDWAPSDSAGAHSLRRQHRCERPDLGAVVGLKLCKTSLFPTVAALLSSCVACAYC